MTFFIFGGGFIVGMYVGLFTTAALVAAAEEDDQ